MSSSTSSRLAAELLVLFSLQITGTCDCPGALETFCLRPQQLVMGEGTTAASTSHAHLLIVLCTLWGRLLSFLVKLHQSDT